jgi:hypothetical protein
VESASVFRGIHIKVKNYNILKKFESNDDYIFEVLTGTYDFQLRWKSNNVHSMFDLDEKLFSFIKDNKDLGIVDINTIVGFPHKS